MIQKPFNISLRGRTIDGNEANEVSWSVSGDIQTAYKIDILSNVDNSLVWTSNKITSYALKHTIPATKLVNGNEYKINVTAWSQTGASQVSDAEIFQTSSRPVVTVSPIGTVNSFSYNFSASYTQDEGVTLRNYTVNLYDDKKNLIDKSNIKTILPMEHLFSNLQTEEQYYIEFIATSAKGLTGTSGMIEFQVFYYRPKMNTRLAAKNIADAGIEISWYVAQVILKNSGGTFINNEKIDVRNGKVIGDEGFKVDKDFTLKLWIEQPYVSNIAEQVDLLKLTGENGLLTLQYHDDNRFHVWKTVNGLASHWMSKSVSGDSHFVVIQQIGDDLNISAEMASST